MRLFGSKVEFGLWYNRILPCLIIADIIAISLSVIFQISEDTLFYLELFDLFVCIILLTEYFFGLIRAPSKRKFIFNFDNLLGLVAAIPFDFIIYLLVPVNFPVYILGYLRLLRLIRIVSFVKVSNVGKFFEKTGFHNIILAIGIIILISTAILCLFGTSYSPFDYFYFVIVTLTTVGYGDITPQTYNEKVITIFLVLIGIIFFSTITASISSFLTDKMMDDGGSDVDEIKKSVEENSKTILNELDMVKKENQKLQREMDELKEIIKNK